RPGADPRLHHAVPDGTPGGERRSGPWPAAQLRPALTRRALRLNRTEPAAPMGRGRRGRRPAGPAASTDPIAGWAGDRAPRSAPPPSPGATRADPGRNAALHR